MIAFVIVITIWNYDTGDKLWDVEIPESFISQEACYRYAIDYALPIVNGIRTYIPNASANVICKQPGTPTPRVWE